MEPLVDGRVVVPGSPERLFLHALTENARGAAVKLVLAAELRVVVRVHDGDDTVCVLCCSTHQRGPSDVDVLDHRLHVVCLEGCPHEIVEVDHNSVDGFNAELLSSFHMIGIIPLIENTARNLRMDRLHLAVEGFRKAGIVGNFDDLGEFVPELFRGAACRENLDTNTREECAELANTFLLGDGHKHSRDGHDILGHIALPAVTGSETLYLPGVRVSTMRQRYQQATVR